eukprot:CAMPEP_0181180460 /NCGR_PEP_ID=MMETSP1096-20121128/6815_1 /TAXON_ID=156174 ORGANISM="Chrysochromulina ericina, Strain CCMP281" /NCGR_SAMPLE_ID=MMETSP1096 /ASSEMBLY_ACC=CAM_ASM_000453 /LENGTH=68 /DNA_ID=CAMNT_0023268897 /DNA_START=350 /DNA_END=556 /DNA_ORIENTATION=-
MGWVLAIEQHIPKGVRAPARIEDVCASHTYTPGLALSDPCQVLLRLLNRLWRLAATTTKIALEDVAEG